MIKILSNGTLPKAAPSSTAPILAITSLIFKASDYLPAKKRIDSTSSATARAKRNVLSSTLTSLPNASNTSITNAISVGITSGQPVDISGAEFSDKNIRAGKIMPPTAAKLGRSICLICVVSLRSCIPIRKKNGARIWL